MNKYTIIDRIFQSFIISLLLTLSVVGVVGVGVFVSNTFGWIGGTIYVIFVGFVMLTLVVSSILDWWHNTQRRLY